MSIENEQLPPEKLLFIDPCNLDGGQFSAGLQPDAAEDREYVAAIARNAEAIKVTRQYIIRARKRSWIRQIWLLLRSLARRINPFSH